MAFASNLTQFYGLQIYYQIIVCKKQQKVSPKRTQKSVENAARYSYKPLKVVGHFLELWQPFHHSLVQGHILSLGAVR
jgi:hypothetical protein